jgi:dTDP-4-dehydrorhamnose 3,5-epimerase
MTRVSIEQIGAVSITPKVFRDHRGWFSEVFNRERFAQAGVTPVFVQDNQSMSAEVGTLRGLHFQTGAHAQAKLVRVVRGRIFDAIVDIRHGSPTYGQWAGLELDAETGTQLFVPAGFAHGFVTLEPNTEILYKVDAYYEPSAEGGLLWNDAEVGIDWPLPPSGPVLNARDAAMPGLSELPQYFTYGA